MQRADGVYRYLVAGIRGDISRRECLLSRIVILAGSGQGQSGEPDQAASNSPSSLGDISHRRRCCLRSAALAGVIRVICTPSF